MSTEREALAEVLYDAEGFHAADSWAAETSIQRGRFDHLAQFVLASDWLAAHDRRVRSEALREAASEIGDSYRGMTRWLLERADAVEADDA